MANWEGATDGDVSRERFEQCPREIIIEALSSGAGGQADDWGSTTTGSRPAEGTETASEGASFGRVKKSDGQKKDTQEMADDDQV